LYYKYAIENMLGSQWSIYKMR